MTNIFSSKPASTLYLHLREYNRSCLSWSIIILLVDKHDFIVSQSSEQFDLKILGIVVLFLYSVMTCWLSLCELLQI